MYSKWLRNLRSSQLCFKVYTKILLPQAMLLYNDAHIGGFIFIYVYERFRSKPSCFCRVFLFCINASRNLDPVCTYYIQTTDLSYAYIPNFTYKVYVQVEISQSLSSRVCVRRFSIVA